MSGFLKMGKRSHPVLPHPSHTGNAIIHRQLKSKITGSLILLCRSKITLFDFVFLLFFLLDEQNNSPSPNHQEMGMTIEQRVSVQDPSQSPKYPFSNFFIYLYKTLVSFFKYSLAVLLLVEVKTLWAVWFWSCHPSRLMLGSDVGGGGASPTPLYWSFVLHLFQYPPTIHPPSKGDKNYQK